MVVNYFVPSAHLSVGAYAVAAMGALLCACARATFTFMVCAIETTHDFHAVVPVILVCVIADAIAVRYMPYSIMTEKLARMGFGAGQDYETNSLKQLRVADVMVRDVATVLPEQSVREVADRFANGDLKTSRHQALPIVDSEGRLQGLVTQGDLLRALQADPEGENERAGRGHAFTGGRVSRRTCLRRRDENARKQYRPPAGGGPQGPAEDGRLHQSRERDGFVARPFARGIGPRARLVAKPEIGAGESRQRTASPLAGSSPSRTINFSSR